MDEWENIDETSLPEKQEFYRNLNMEDITDADYMHAKKVSKDFETKRKLVNIMICILKMMHYFWLIFPKTSEKCV